MISKSHAEPTKAAFLTEGQAEPLFKAELG